jgi:hypothetical protein
MGESPERRTISSGRANRPRVLPRRPSRDLAPLLFFTQRTKRPGSVQNPGSLCPAWARCGPSDSQIERLQFCDDDDVSGLCADEGPLLVRRSAMN